MARSCQESGCVLERGRVRPSAARRTQRGRVWPSAARRTQRGRVRPSAAKCGQARPSAAERSLARPSAAGEATRRRPRMLPADSISDRWPGASKPDV